MIFVEKEPRVIAVGTGNVDAWRSDGRLHLFVAAMDQPGERADLKALNIPSRIYCNYTGTGLPDLKLVLCL